MACTHLELHTGAVGLQPPQLTLGDLAELNDFFGAKVHLQVEGGRGAAGARKGHVPATGAKRSNNDEAHFLEEPRLCTEDV